MRFVIFSLLSFLLVCRYIYLLLLCCAVTNLSSIRLLYTSVFTLPFNTHSQFACIFLLASLIFRCRFFSPSVCAYSSFVFFCVQVIHTACFSHQPAARISFVHTLPIVRTPFLFLVLFFLRTQLIVRALSPFLVVIFSHRLLSPACCFPIGQQIENNCFLLLQREPFCAILLSVYSAFLIHQFSLKRKQILLYAVMSFTKAKVTSVHTAVYGNLNNSAVHCVNHTHTQTCANFCKVCLPLSKN